MAASVASRAEVGAAAHSAAKRATRSASEFERLTCWLTNASCPRTAGTTPPTAEPLARQYAGKSFESSVGRPAGGAEGRKRFLTPLPFRGRRLRSP